LGFRVFTRFGKLSVLLVLRTKVRRWEKIYFENFFSLLQSGSVLMSFEEPNHSLNSFIVFYLMMEIVPNSFPNKFDAENQKFGLKESKVFWGLRKAKGLRIL
jgi:hypothetical protein